MFIIQVRKLVDLFVLLWSTVILRWEPYLYRTGRGVIMCKAERKENIFSPFKIKVKFFSSKYCFEEYYIEEAFQVTRSCGDKFSLLTENITGSKGEALTSSLFW